MLDRWLSDSIESEYEDADFNDHRLTDRLLTLAAAMGTEPTGSVAKVTRSRAAREGAYRFLENFRVTMEGVLEPHVRATTRRCQEVGTVYVVSDTTEFRFKGRERGKKLGRLQGHDRGFLGHFALAVSASGPRVPLGVVGIAPLVRADKPVTKHRNDRQKDGDLERESARWAQMVEHSEQVLAGVETIHVMDREADMFELLCKMNQDGRRYVVRGGRDRVATDGKLAEVVKGAPAKLEREVQLSAQRKRTAGKSRVRPARLGRVASLQVSAMEVTLRRPKRSPSHFAAELTLNVVEVVEVNAPVDQAPVHWTLFTSEKIDTPEQVAAVIDAYRARWLIEDFFKAIKTGCAYEDRQLRSMSTLTKALALLAPIAWRMLLLRSLDRAAPDTVATEVLDPVLLEALAAKLKENGEPKALPPAATVADVMQAIARLGAHHPSNGPPGWQVLWRGFQELLLYGAGFIAGKSAAS